MRVLVWQWGRSGSGSRYAFEMARALSEYCSHESLLSLAEGAELMQNSACRASVDLPLYTYANAQEFVGRSLFIKNVLRPIFQKLRAKPPHAAIVPMMGYWDIFMIRYLHSIGVPVVVVIHDAEVHPGDHFHLMVRLQRHLMGLSEGVVMLSDFVASKVKTRLSLASKVHTVIPHVSFAFRDLDLPAPLPLETAPKRPLRLLLAGRLKSYKGIPLLVDALKLLGGVPLALRVVGSSGDPSDLSSLSALPGVELDLGWKKECDFLSHFDWADACVLPYVEASQSGVVPLSFQRERPVIATPVGGIPEQVHHEVTGLLTEDVSATALAASIRRFAENPSLVRRLGNNARIHAESNLSWRVLAPRFVEVLEAVSSRRLRK